MIGLLLAYVDILFTCNGGFNYLGSWSDFKKWVSNLGAKSKLNCFREVKCQLGETPVI